MAVFTAIIISLLFGLTPLVVSVLMLPVLCQGTAASLPRPFLISQVLLALLARPILDVIARIWLWQPVLPLAVAIFSASSGGVAFAVVLFGLAALFVLATVLQNTATVVKLFFDNVNELNPFHFSKNLRQSASAFLETIDKLFDKANFTEMFQDVQPPPNMYRAMPNNNPILRTAGDVFNPISTYYNLTEALRNLTVSESTQSYLDTINAALIDLLQNIEVSSVFNITRLPPSLHTPLNTVSEALHDLADNLNITELLTEVTVPSNLQDSLSNLGKAVETVGLNLNVTELYETAGSYPEVKETLKLFDTMGLLQLNPSRLFEFFVMPAGATSWQQAFGAFVSWIPISFRGVIWASILIVIVCIPLMFVVRAALQDGCAWLVYRRYETNISSSQRSASGWMFVAAISALSVATTEAFPFCFFCGLLYASKVWSPQTTFVFLCHVLTAIPLRAASQMRIAEADVRRDVLRESKAGLISGFLWAAIVNGSFNMWWMLFSIVLVASVMTFWVPVLFLSVYACVVWFSLFWGHTIYGRVLKAEQQMIEDRQRKRD